MLHILSIVAPIFIVIACGYVAVRVGLVEAGIAPMLSQFIMYISLPALLIMALARSNPAESFSGLFMLAYGGGALGSYALAQLAARWISKDDATRAGVKSFGSAFPNSVFIGYPLLVQIYPEPPVAIFAMALTFENIVMMPLALSMLESAQGHSGAGALRATLRRLVSNPIMIAIVIGLLLALSGLEIPAVIGQSLEILSRATAGAALFFIGLSLASARLGSELGAISSIAIIKLLVHPALVIALIVVLPPFEPSVQQAAIILAASPMATIYPILCSRYGQGELSSGALLITTTSALFSISALLYWLLPGLS